MNKYLLWPKQNLPIIFFIGRFCFVYIASILLYHLYLNSFKNIDPYTNFLSKLIETILSLKYEIFVSKTPYSNDFYSNDTYVFSIVEGCNAISIFIVFISFIWGVKRKFTDFIIFSLINFTVFATANVSRILILSVLYLRGSDLAQIFHHTLFPGIMYAIVLLSWLIWIRGAIQQNKI